MRKSISIIFCFMLCFLVFPINIHSQSSDPITHTISIRNYAFDPNELHVEIGDIVMFKWEDGAMGHNVEQVSNSKDTSYDDGGFRSGDPQKGPSEWTLPSSYTEENVTLFYICNPHVLTNNMRGQIIVGTGSEDTADSGANVALLLGIFLGSGVLTVALVAILQRQKKTT